jgi:hypothetical protein
MRNPQGQTSEGTSIPQVAGLFKWWVGSGGVFTGINLDMGGGKFDLVQEWMNEEKFNCRNLVSDPFNRSQAHNDDVMARTTSNGGADSVTIANVLNVIDDRQTRIELMGMARKFAKHGAPILISCYQGDLSGKGRITKSADDPRKSSWQNHLPVKAYSPEVKEALGVFEIRRFKGNSFFVSFSG